MNPQPAVSVYASYIRKENEFFTWGRSLGEYEISAVNLSAENINEVILTDFLPPDRESTRRLRSGSLENGNHVETERILGNQVELIATKRHCWLSAKFYDRIKVLMDGLAHNHFENIRPSAIDILALAHSLHRTNQNHRYAVDTIHHDGEFDIFCFLKSDLNYLLEHEVLPNDYIEKWLDKNYSRIHVGNYKIIQDK